MRRVQRVTGDSFTGFTIMSYQDSPFSTMYDRQDDYDLDEDNEEYMEDERDAEDQDESDEGTGIIKQRFCL